jgi:methyl-accepting chemotaxis protein
MLSGYSIKAKITLMGLAAGLGMAAIFVITFLSANHVDRATLAAEALRGDIEILANLQLTNMDLLLTAMDTIVDKDEGKVDPDRKQSMTGSVQFMRDNVALIERMGKQLGKQAAVKDVKANIEVIAKGALVDLVRAVETRGNDDAFAALDDAIDGTGEKLGEAFTVLNEAGQAALTQSISEANEAAAEGKTQTIIVSLIALLVIGSFMFITARSILESINSLTGVMGRLAANDLDVAVPVAGQDEMGQMARAVQVFKDNAIERTRLAEAERSQLAAREERAKRIDDLISRFESESRTILEELAKSSNDLEQTAQSMSATAEQTSNQASTMSSAADQASGNVQTVAAAAEELSVSISGIRQNARTASETVSAAAAQAQSTNETVQGMAEAAQRIGKVVELIADIASQTNLLALNATIEAARAGEAGKGFAVVASEVKNLANQTAKATEDISHQVDGIQKTSRAAADAIGAFQKTIEQVNSAASQIASAIEEQASATMEISRNVQQASSGTAEVSSNVRMVNDAADETGKASQNVLAASQQLADQAKMLRQGVSQFLQGIRAA